MRRSLILALALSLAAAPVLASSYRSAAMKGEGSVLATVQAPAGWGDGRVTERDALALSEYCVWGFNRMLEAEGLDVTLGRDAEDRMVEFWFAVWDHLDGETQTVASQADVLWPHIRSQYEEGSEETREALVMQFAEIMTAMWGGYEIQTVQYLAGEISPEEYGMLLQQALAANSGRGGRGGPGGRGIDIDAMTGHQPNYEQDRVINDGSGDIEYVDPN